MKATEEPGSILSRGCEDSSGPGSFGKPEGTRTIELEHLHRILCLCSAYRILFRVSLVHCMETDLFIPPCLAHVMSAGKEWFIIASRVFVLLRIIFKYLKTGLKSQIQVLKKKKLST